MTVSLASMIRDGKLDDELGMAAAAPKEARPKAAMKTFGSITLYECWADGRVEFSVADSNG